MNRDNTRLRELIKLIKEEVEAKEGDEQLRLERVRGLLQRSE